MIYHKRKPMKSHVVFSVIEGAKRGHSFSISCTGSHERNEKNAYFTAFFSVLRLNNIIR